MNKTFLSIIIIFKKEILSYFSTPVAYVFITIYLVLSGLFTFYLGNFFSVGQANLNSFFEWHPWLYLLLIPSVSMRLWSEEKRNGTIELLTTLPIKTISLVIGKFFAAWFFIFVALSLTTPMWLTVNYLGNPDNGIIVAGYLGSLLMAGGYLSIGSCVSALTKNQVIAFIISVTICFLFTLSGLPIVLDFFNGWAGQNIIDIISSFSFLSNFYNITRGIVQINSILYFISLITFFLTLNTIIINDLED